MYKRIIGLVLIDNGIVCRTRNFNPDYHYTEAHIDTDFFDEICLIDVTREKSNETSRVFLAAVDKLMTKSQLPISIGGSIHSPDDIHRYRSFGADRYLINQTCSSRDPFVINCIREFGRSSIISSINHWNQFLYFNHEISGIKLSERIKEIQNNCGSEILINSVERDGTLTGMDEMSIREISTSSPPPLIINGGLGRATQAGEMLKIESVSAVCTSNIYHLTTRTI